jgi:hypothetical protein
MKIKQIEKLVWNSKVLCTKTEIEREKKPIPYVHPWKKEDAETNLTILRKHAFNYQRPQHVQVEGGRAPKTLAHVMRTLTIFFYF